MVDEDDEQENANFFFFAKIAYVSFFFNAKIIERRSLPSSSMHVFIMCFIPSKN